MLRKITLTALLLQVMSIAVFSQIQTEEGILRKSSVAVTREAEENFGLAMKLAKEKGWLTHYKTRSGNIAFLVGVADDGSPLYLVAESNVTGAKTTGAFELWAGGSSGLNLNGSSLNVKNKMALWDEGRVMETHQELVGRVTQMDGAGTFGSHATHVAGTMIASGVNANAKGMAHGIQGLLAYDFGSDAGEMFGAAPNLVISNHSYGFPAGWSYNSTLTRWEFLGAWGENEDRTFGYYDDRAQLWDSIAYNAPYYLIVKSSGNVRSENGPDIGATYWRRDASNNFVSAVRGPELSSNDSYGTISRNGNAKNILTVGAINGLTNGYTGPFGVLMSSFSSWGPTDDGRIKPDVVAMGVSVLSSWATSTTSYATIQGTSMSSPGVTGSLLLLQEYHNQLNPNTFMRAATLKGLAIHTAEEAGFSAGPDYKFGWGVLNVNKAAAVIKSKNTGSHRIYENVLNNGGSFTTSVMANGPLTVTISWTDPKGNVVTSNILNNPELKLVNDLDVRVTKGTTTYFPWIMDPAAPDNAATTGDNFRDNAEKINVAATAGEFYTITVTHKGNLQRGTQAYSLILSGVGGPVYCASGATSTAGSRIDSVSFGGVNKQNPAGCTTYTNYTTLTASVQPSQTLPLFVALNSCDASSANKIVKVFIDWNGNGNFTDAGELVATSNVIAGNGNFTQNITVPGNVSIGATTAMRIVAMETSNPADVLPCGTYPNGETQDFMVSFVPAANDMTITELVSPKTNSCEDPSQLLTIKLKNNGTVSKTNIPVTAVIKNGASTVATITETFKGTLAAGASADYTFQTPFNSQASNTFSIQAYVADPAEQAQSNDTLQVTVTVAANPPAPSGGGVICGANALLGVTNPTGGAAYLWYNDASSNVPFAAGPTVSTSTIPANNTFYLGRGARGTLGLAAKTAFPGGGGYVSTPDLATSNYIRYNSSVPLILESAKLYIKQGGKINIVVASISGTTINFAGATTTTIDVYPTSANPAGGNQPNDPNDNGAYYRLNVALPAGDNVVLVQTVGDANIFRNDNVTGNPYPFSIPGLITISGNSATNIQGSYFFFYDMKLKTADCVSPKASIVVAQAPTPAISQVADSLVSSIDNGNQWYLNNVSINGANEKKYKPTASGSYTVRVTDAYGCQMTSTAFSFIATSVINLPSADIRLTVAPNPNRGSFVLRFNLEKKEDLMVDLVNIQGQKISSRTYPKYQGAFNQQLNFKNLASGVYVLRIQHGSKVYHEKIVIE